MVAFSTKDHPFWKTLWIRLKLNLFKFLSVKVEFLFFLGWILKEKLANDWKILTVYLTFGAFVLGIRDFKNFAKKQLVDKLGGENE